MVISLCCAIDPGAAFPRLILGAVDATGFVAQAPCLSLIREEGPEHGLSAVAVAESLK